MTQLAFTADYGNYGQARAQLSAALPLGWDRAPAAGALVSYGLSQQADYDEVTQHNAYDVAEQHLMDRACSSISWELVTDGTVLGVFELLADVQAAGGRFSHRLLSHAVKYI